MKLKRKNVGMSFIETTIVIGILALIATLSMSSFINFAKSEALKSNTSAIVSGLREARSKTLASVGGSQFGVKVDNDRFTSFQGSTFSSSTPGNVTFMFSSYVRATSSIGTFVFSKLTGNSSASGTIAVYIPSDLSIKKTVSVQTTGLVNSQ